MIGQTISHYKILEKLGEGGMGIVYKAEDTKLKRTVALKFLAADLTRDPDAKKRFIQEARAASALDHANICNIHAIEETTDGQIFISMAVYSGETLRDKIARGPVEPGEAAAIASQIAMGLEMAHGEGIVHRDLKPANIFVTDDGRVKILDFGLAKLAGEARLTKTGSTVGTVAYMSPEQASGAGVDYRTDIWALGVILYEMLTGELPFQGDHEQAIIYSIINKKLRPVSEVRPGVPHELAGVAKRALRKDPNLRYSSAAEMRAGLSGVVAGVAPAGAARRSLTRLKSIFPYLVLLAAFAVILVVVTRHTAQKHGRSQPPVNRQVTFVGNIRSPRLSPDGNLVAYVHREEESRFGLWIKDRETGSSINIYSAPFCVARKWSPDGSRLLFSALHGDTLGGMYTIPRNGGEPRLVFDSPWPFSAWAPDGSSIAFLTVGSSEISIVDLSTGETKTLAIDVPEDEDAGSKITGEAAELDWSLRNGLLLVQIDDTKHQSFYTINPESGRQTLIFKTGYNPNALVAAPRWSPVDDAVYFFKMKVKGQSLTDLMRLKFDSETMAAESDPAIVLSGLPMSELEFSMSADGSTFLYERETGYSNMFLLTVTGEEKSLEVEEIQLTRGTTWKSRPQISPDGESIVFSMNDGDHSNIYVMTLPGEAMDGETVQPSKQLTFLSATNDLPVWSPDGSEIAFYSTHEGTPRIWHVSSAGGRAEPYLNTEYEPWVSDHLAWAPGGKIVYRKTGIRNFSVFDPVSGENSALVEDDSLGYVFQALWSPDSTQIVFFWNRDSARPPSMGVWVKSMADGSMKKLIDGAVAALGWTADGKWVWAFKYRVIEDGDGPNNIFRINVRSGEREDWIEKPYEGFNDGQCAMTADGRRFVCSKPERHADAWIVENFDPESD